MWSGPKKEADRIWCANHFTTILNINQSTSFMETESSIEIVDDKVEGLDTNETQPQTILCSNKPTIWYSAQMEKEIENKSKATCSTSAIDKKHIFLEAPAIIQRMITVVKEGRFFDQPPKMITHASIFMIKQTDEDWKSIGKDGNGVWKQMSSVKILFVLKDLEKYQIVRREGIGNFLYNERVGNRYISCPVKPNQFIMIHRSVIICVYCSILIIFIYRYYATYESNPSLRRMIAYSNPMLTEDDSVTKKTSYLLTVFYLQLRRCEKSTAETT